MSTKKNLLNMRFGRLIVIEESEPKNGKAAWKCKCDCGNFKITTSGILLRGECKSCNCLIKETSQRNGRLTKKHGLRYTNFYSVWRTMKLRCYVEKNVSYKYYGLKGIKVCKEWHKFENFMNDMYESYLEHCKIFGQKNTTLERINFKKNYCKENCRWATRKEQANNRKDNKYITYNSKRQTLTMWANELGIRNDTLNWRLNNGWSKKRAFFEPVNKKV